MRGATWRICTHSTLIHFFLSFQNRKILWAKGNLVNRFKDLMAHEVLLKKKIGERFLN